MHYDLEINFFYVQSKAVLPIYRNDVDIKNNQINKLFKGIIKIKTRSRSLPSQTGETTQYCLNSNSIKMDAEIKTYQGT